MNANEKMLKEAPFGRLLLKLSLPSVVIMVVMVVYNMADVFFIGKTGNPYMIAAVSLCGPLFSILSGLGTLFGSGGCTAISLELGRGNKQKIRRISSFCFYTAIMIGGLFLLIVLLLLKPICLLIGSDETTLQYAMEYLRVIALFAPAIISSGVLMNMIRSDGAAVESMIANALGTAVNILLDPVMILLLRWNVTGAAIATGIGNMISLAYAIRYIRKKNTLFSLKLRDIQVKKEIIFPVLTLGLPLAFSTILMSFSHMISNNMMMRYGSVAVAAQGVGGKIGMLITMIAMGICMGMQPAISYNYSAGNAGRLREILKKTALTSILIGSILSVGCFLLRDRLLIAFIDNEEVLRIGRVVVTAAVMVGPFYGIYQLSTNFLQSIGKAGYATFASLLNKGLLFLPALFLLNAVFQMYGVIFAATVSDGLSVIAGVLLCFPALRKERAADGQSGNTDNESYIREV